MEHSFVCVLFDDAVSSCNDVASIVDELTARKGHRWSDTDRDIESTRRSIERPVVPQLGIKFLTNYGTK
jgi:hypothetical protein